MVDLTWMVVLMLKVVLTLMVASMLMAVLTLMGFVDADG
jgi:hypothetical protein